MYHKLFFFSIMLRFIQEVDFIRKLVLIEFGNGKDTDRRDMGKSDEIKPENSCYKSL